MAPSQNNPQTPVRSHGQRMDALKKANEIRAERSRLKKGIKSGDIDIIDVLENPPEYLMTAKVMDLVLVVPKYGRVKATRVLTKCRISQSKTVGGLSERQRNELIAMLRARNGG